MQTKRYIASRMREKKDDWEMNMDEFSEELTLARSTVQKYLRGEANATVETLEIVADKFGISVAELVSDPNGPGAQLWQIWENELTEIKKLHPRVQPIAKAQMEVLLELSNMYYEMERNAHKQ